MQFYPTRIFDQPDVFDGLVSTIQGWLESGPQLPAMSVIEYLAIPQHERGQTRWLENGDCFLTIEAVYYRNEGSKPTVLQYECLESAKQLEWSMELDALDYRYKLRASEVPDGVKYQVDRVNPLGEVSLDIHIASQLDFDVFKESMSAYLESRLVSFERSIEPQRSALKALIERYR